MSNELRALNGVAQIQAHNRDAWLHLLLTWGPRAVQAACTACGIPARITAVEEALLDRFAPLPSGEPAAALTPPPAPAAPAPAAAPTPPPAQEPPMAAQPTDQPALLERLQAAAKSRGATLVSIYREMGSSSSLGSLLRHSKAGPAQLAKVNAWLDGAATWAGMSGAAQDGGKALAKALTTTKAKRRRLGPAAPAVQPAAARQYLLDIAAILGVRPVTVYLVQGDRLVESQALPVGAA
jgi:hypothetical protein